MSHVQLIVLGFSIIFAATILGSATVYLFKKDISEKANTVFLGFAAGIMIAASIWSLLIPAINESSGWGNFSFVPAAVGFIIGGLLLTIIDELVPHLHHNTNVEEGLHSSLKKSGKLFLAITIHNIPEGLAVGFAFGAAAVVGTNAAFMAALGLAIGIAVQNFPEGAAVSLPMRLEAGSKNKAFLFGVGSGAVEPLAAVIGYFLAAYIAVLQPWLLSLAAGAMIFVVIEDIIPESKMVSHPHLGSWSAMIGFVLMMVLDIALG